MGYKLVNHGYPYKVITGKRGKAVGRVYKNAQGTYTGMIGKNERTAATEVDAFRAVASVALGFEDVEAVRNHNRAVRAANKARRNNSQRIVNDMLRGDFNSLDQLLGFKR